jgi:hypothetical protein
MYQSPERCGKRCHPTLQAVLPQRPPGAPVLSTVRATPSTRTYNGLALQASLTPDPRSAVSRASRVKRVKSLAAFAPIARNGYLGRQHPCLCVVLL